MDKDKLANRIWFTKKARYNAEARLIKLENRLSFLLAYYSIFFVSIQIFPRFIPQAASAQLDWISTTVSLFLLVFSLLIAGHSFKLKAEKMKNCYHELSDIEQKLEKGKDIDEVFEEYNNVLKRYDNHLPHDYYLINLWKKQFEGEGSGGFLIRHAKVLGAGVLYWLIFIFLLTSPIFVMWKYIGPYLNAK